MPRIPKQMLVAIMSLGIALTTIESACASETVRATRTLTITEAAYRQLENAKDAIVSFEVKDAYCIGRDNERIAADKASLKSLITDAENALDDINGHKNFLTEFIRPGAGKIGKLNEIVDGVGTKVADDTYFTDAAQLLENANEAYQTALMEIEANTRDCVGAKSKTPTSATPGAPSPADDASASPVSDDVASKASEYMAGVPLTGEYQELEFPSVPNPLCSEEEKNAISREYFRLENIAIANHRVARKLRLSIFEKMDEYKIAQRATAKGSTKDLAYNIALAKLAAAFDNAVKEVAHRTKALDDVRSGQRKLWDTPVVDCSKKDDHAETEVGVIDRLKTARKAAPGFTGASGSSFGFPDFGKIDRRRVATGGAGFDGSEAESAVRDAVKKVDMTPRVYIVEEPSIFAEPHSPRSVPAKTATPAEDLTPAPKTTPPLGDAPETRGTPSVRPIDVAVDHSKKVSIAKPGTAPKPAAPKTPKTAPVADKKPLTFTATFDPHPGAPTSDTGTMTAVEAPPLVVLDYLGNPVGTKITDDEKSKHLPPKGE